MNTDTTWVRSLVDRWCVDIRVGRWPEDQYRRGNYDSTDSTRFRRAADDCREWRSTDYSVAAPRNCVQTPCTRHVTSRQLICSAPDTPPNHSVVVSSYNLGSMILTFFFFFSSFLVIANWTTGINSMCWLKRKRDLTLIADARDTQSHPLLFS